MRFFKSISADLRAKVTERFWKKVDRLDDISCWLWSAATKDNGYGYFRISRQHGMIGAHKAAWILTNGDVDTGLYVCHKCDNRRCCNPAHLWLGTHTQNQKDMAEKRRGYSPAKRLSDSDVEEIRNLLDVGVTAQAVADQYLITAGYVRRIKARTSRG